MIGLGLGLAIDYTLFLVTRFREELGNGTATNDAIKTTMATAGRTVAFSALTVAAALATLTLFPLRFAQSMGIAGASVAIVAAVASLAVSPALLAIWGHKLLPKNDRRAAATYDRWYRLAHGVMRRPGLIAAGTAALMLLIALPAIGVKWTPTIAHLVARSRTAPPAHVMFLPAFWLLVPGTIGLIGVTELVGDNTEQGSANLAAALISIPSVALGILVGTMFVRAAAIATRSAYFRRKT